MSVTLPTNAVIVKAEFSAGWESMTILTHDSTDQVPAAARIGLNPCHQ
jgi:hypothetical protein